MAFGQLQVVSSNYGEAFTAGMNFAIEQIVKKTVLDIHANLVAKPSNGGTPVDTGWARANWIPRIGGPVETPVGTRPKTIADFNASAVGDLTHSRVAVGSVDFGAQQQGLATVVTGYKVNLGPVYISNAVPYIGRLDAGSSTQAPAGFIGQAVVKAVVQDSRS